MKENELAVFRMFLKNLPYCGVKVVELAEKLNVHPQTIYHYMKDYNIPQKRLKHLLYVLKRDYPAQVRDSIELLDVFQEDTKAIDDIFDGLGISLQEEKENGQV